MKSFTSCDGNSRKTWEIINEVTGRKSEKAIINELEFEDKKLTDYCITALIETIDSWSLNVDSGFVNAVVFLDLKKVFDTVNHAILLSKLRAHGIRDSANQWFCSHLRNRVQTCLVDCNKSSETYVPCGVPQGTILGPLLFLHYIIDLPNCLMHSQPIMYADDTSITYASNDVEEIERCVNIDLDRIRIQLFRERLS